MRRALALLAICALVPIGCGDGDGTGDDPMPEAAPAASAELTAAERRAFDRDIRAIQRHCRRWARFLTEGERLSPEQSAQGFAAVEGLLELLRRKPRAPIGRSADVRLRVGDIAESVEGANCDPRLEQRLDEGIAAALGGG